MYKKQNVQAIKGGFILWENKRREILRYLK